MRKLLLGTTAIAAASALSAPALAEDGKISLSVGGYYQNFISFVDQDDDFEGEIPVPVADREFNPVNVRHEGEIHFKGETTLDNGLTVGFQAQLEAITQGDQMDETYLYFSGSWGRLIMGSENSAPYLMAYAAPYAGLGVNSPNFFLFSPLGTAATSGFLNFASDANKITYFTPRFGGFQLGVSYTPNTDAVGGNRQTFGLNTDEDVGDYNHVIGAGLNFVESFNAVDIAIFAGAEWANLEMDSGNAFKDYQSYQGGLNIGFAGFTLGGSVSYNDAGIDDAGVGADADIWFYDVGATYGSGPWTIGLTYSHASYDVDSSIVDIESDRDLVELGVSYALAPGVTLVGALQWMDEDNDLEGDIGGDLPVEIDFGTEGFAGAIGTKLTF